MASTIKNAVAQRQNAETQNRTVREQAAEDMNSGPCIADCEGVPAKQEAEVIHDEGTTQDT